MLLQPLSNPTLCPPCPHPHAIHFYSVSAFIQSWEGLRKFLGSPLYPRHALIGILALVYSLQYQEQSLVEEGRLP